MSKCPKCQQEVDFKTEPVTIKTSTIQVEGTAMICPQCEVVIAIGNPPKIKDPEQQKRDREIFKTIMSKALNF